MEDTSIRQAEFLTGRVFDSLVETTLHYAGQSYALQDV